MTSMAHESDAENKADTKHLSFKGQLCDGYSIFNYSILQNINVKYFTLFHYKTSLHFLSYAGNRPSNNMHCLECQTYLMWEDMVAM